MMHYYINNRTQPNGEHQIHRTGCTFMPDSETRTYLGQFDSSASALAEARRRYKQATLCHYCCENRTR